MTPATVSPTPVLDHATGAVDERFRLGSLLYTKKTLGLLFFWLLWGDLVFQLVELVVPNVLPLKLKDLNTPGWLIGLLIGTLPSAINFIVNPIVSFRSDRHRSRFGRRIPFLLWATPPLALLLAGVGMSADIGKWIHTALGGGSSTLMILIVLSALLVLFQVAHMVVGSTYYYLFVDTVPTAFIGRFFGLFRLVGILAGAGFNFFIFPLAGDYLRWIFIGAAAAYLVGFMLMCWRVKEGQYPPPPPNVDGQAGTFSTIKTYFAECFTHRVYVYFFLMTCFATMGGGAFAFIQLFRLSVGLSLSQIGQMLGWSMIAGGLLTYPAGVLSDRIHPFRVCLACCGLNLLATALYIPFLYDLSKGNIWWLSVATIATSTVIGTLYTAGVQPLMMRLFARSHYGQISSANAALGALGGMVGGVVFGALLDLMADPSLPDRQYKYAPLLGGIAVVMQCVFYVLCYREFRKLGGEKQYVAPLEVTQNTFDAKGAGVNNQNQVV